MPFEGPTGELLRKALLATVVVLGVFLAVQAIGGLMQWRYIGAGLPAANTITVSGHGEAMGVPDIATFSFSVVSEKSTVDAAQADATAKANAVTAYLKSAGVDEKDIQTSNYSVNPQYDYTQAACTGGYCPGGKQTLRGYEVRQTTTIKVRTTAKAGDLLAGVGSKGATEVSGLSFTFDDPQAIQDEARDKAIADAKEKAETLAKQLGVSIVRVTAFNENGSGYPRAVMYSAMDAYGKGGVTAPAAPEISVGQNKVTNDVSITYEIR
ncbi:SIMPL domain-containing protein [Patescibacteria group bacterium]|nr:SIMPL domain-containing protein [Patescibacteria group bacterium]